MTPVIERFLKSCTQGFVLAEPNAGMPELIDGQTVFPLGPERFAELTAPFAAMGCKLVGGCCGTSPEHIRQLRKAVEAAARPASAGLNPNGIPASSSRAVRIWCASGPAEPFEVIGERIESHGQEGAAPPSCRPGEYGHGPAASPIRAGGRSARRVLDVERGRAQGRSRRRLLPELVQRFSPASIADAAFPRLLASRRPLLSGPAVLTPASPARQLHSAATPGPHGASRPCRAAHCGAPFILLPMQRRASCP